MAVKASASITLSFMVDVKATYRSYKLQASTAAAPSVPTDNPPTGWTDTEPSYTSGSTNTLYFVDLTVFSNDTYLYSLVSKSSSYEAAKEAYNKAVAANNVATNAQDNINNLQVGGRNLLLKTKTFDECTAISKTSETYNGLTVRGGTISSEKTTVCQYSCFTGFNLEDIYTFSFYAKGDLNELHSFFYGDTGCVKVKSIASNGITTSGDFGDGNTSFSISSEWKRYFVTWKLSSSGDITIPKYILLRTDGSTSGQEIYVCGCKMEKGNRSTDWTPATEDVDGAISDVDTKSKEAAKTATNYMNYSDDVGLIVGNMTDTFLGKNVLIDVDGVHIRNGETTLASFKVDSIIFNKQVTFKADGIQLDNGDAYCDLGKNNILWSDDTGKWMRDTDSITLTTNITSQLSGAVFAWCAFDTSTNLPTNSNWLYFFIPKSHVINRPGDGIRMSDPYIGMNKYIYVSNSIITGHANNGISSTLNGISFNNSNYVLRYVIGV